MRRLAAHRTVALQVMLSRKSEVALAAVAHVFVQRVFGDEYRRAGSALQITPQLSAHALQAVADDLKQSTAWQALEAARLAWKERLPANAAEWFGWLVALPQTELLDLLALCSASTLNALPNSGAASDANTLAEAVGLDMADWWEPTALGFLNHVSKAQIADALKEAGPELPADTSRELASFDYEMKHDFSLAVEDAVYSETFAWAWQTVPMLLHECSVFNLQVEEAETPLTGTPPEYIRIYGKERMSSMQLVQTLLKKQRRFEYIVRPAPQHTPVHPTDFVVNMLRRFMRAAA